MYIFKLIVAALWFFVAAGTSFSQSLPASEIKVGVGETVITPSIGMPMAGYFRYGVSDGIHDDLHTRSIIIQDKDDKVLLMSVAVVSIPKSVFNGIRQGVKAATGIPEGNIIISATHTHSGPAIADTPDSAYTKLLIEKSVESAVIAWKSRVPGKIGAGIVPVFDVGRNDRRLDYGGVDPDSEAGILRIEQSDGKLIGVAFFYGCHPSAMSKFNLKFTEDWPYFAIRDIKRKVGNDVMVAYFQSAQGDVKLGGYTAELSAVGADIPTRTFEFAEKKAGILADVILEGLAKVETTVSTNVEAVEDTVNLPAREGYRLTTDQAAKELEQAKTNLDNATKNADNIGKRMLDKYKVEVFLAGLRLDTAKMVSAPDWPKEFPILQQVIRFGDMAIVSFPCEVFTEISVQVKQKSPFKQTFVAGLSSPIDSYLPTSEEFKEDRYADITSLFSPDAGQVLIDSSIKLMEKLKK